MTRRHEDSPIRMEEEVSLLSQEDRLGKTTLNEAEQYDERHPLTSDILEDRSPENQRFVRRTIRKKSQRSQQLIRLRRCMQTHRKCGLVVAAIVGVLLLLLTAGGVVVFKTTPNDGQSPPWYPTPSGGALSSWRESYEKAAALVNKMSLVEKVNVTTGVGWQMGLCVGNTAPAMNVKFPSLCFQDGPLGIRFADNISAFPAGITVGATWNRDLMYKRGRAHGREARAKGVNVLLGPAMGPLGRMPAGGRNWEGFGSDPVLQGVAAAQTIRGIQDEGVMATAKHYILNEQEHFRQAFEWGLPNAISSNADDRTLHEIYLWPFAESVRAGVASIMCSYQMVNNSYACGNSKLLNGILKDELGFQGFVQSDWLAQRSGVGTALAGLDVTMPGDGLYWANGDSLWGSQLTSAILNGSIPMSRLNDMVLRVVAAWYQLGQNDSSKFPPSPPLGDGGPNFSSWTNDEEGLFHHGSGEGERGIVNKFIDVQVDHGDLIREIGAEAITLLKNDDGVLPLSRDGLEGRGGAAGKFKVAIIGEDAGEGKGPNACPDRGCNQGTLASGWGSGAVEFPYLVNPNAALSGAFNKEKVDVSSFLTNDVPSSGSLVDQDLCLVFVNADAGEGYLSHDGVSGDRNDLFPQKGGDKLVQAVAENCGSGKGSTVAVVHSVGPVVVERWIDLKNVKGLLFAHLPGQESGNSLIDVLFGDVNPSGKLPYTVGKTLEDYGKGGQVLYTPNGVIPQQNFDEGIYIDYRHFDKHAITPRYEFGFGLSYTTFELSNLVVTPTKPKSAFPSPRPDGLSPIDVDETIPPASEAILPAGFKKLKKYIYPYIESETDIKAGKYPYPEGYDTVQSPSPAGGGEGGNPSLWDVHAEVEVTVTNTGQRTGKEVVQLYLSFPENVRIDDLDGTDRRGPFFDFPVKVLRGFEKVEVEPGKTERVRFSLTRKDMSYWSSKYQNWIMPTRGHFRVRVGNSSRNLPLSANL